MQSYIIKDPSVPEDTPTGVKISLKNRILGKPTNLLSLVT